MNKNFIVVVVSRNYSSSIIYFINYETDQQKKPKVKYFMKADKLEVEKVINEFLSQHESIDVKSIAMDDQGIMLLYEE